MAKIQAAELMKIQKWNVVTRKKSSSQDSTEFIIVKKLVDSSRDFPRHTGEFLVAHEILSSKFLAPSKDRDLSCANKD